MRAVTGQGCNKNPPVRKDLPLHDMTGGNYWMPDAIKYLDGQGKLRVGGGLTSTQLAAMTDGKARAMKQLSAAASLVLNGNTLTIYNLTGHKLISGYPEGRRMWVNVKWKGAGDVLLREDGAYGPIAVSVGGTAMQVDSILDLHDPNTRIYEAHYAMTQEWASQLVALGYPASLPISYDRSPARSRTPSPVGRPGARDALRDLHFALNNIVAKDNRIPPYRMSYDEAAVRNALPVPADQYGNPGAGGVYNCWDEIVLDPPREPPRDYQPDVPADVMGVRPVPVLGNNRQNAFLANEGIYLLDAWLNTGMAART